MQLLSRREPIYRESAHLIVDTEGKSPEQLADEILAGFRFSTMRVEVGCPRKRAGPSGASPTIDGFNPLLVGLAPLVSPAFRPEP